MQTEPINWCESEPARILYAVRVTYPSFTAEQHVALAEKIIREGDVFYLRNWEGHQILEAEPKDAKILVWEITPHPTDSAFDAVVERDYSKALEHAQAALLRVVDEAEEKTLRESGMKVQMKLIEMTLAEYEELPTTV